MPNRDDIIRSFTEEQAAIYNNVLGNIEDIKKGWMMCRKFYDDATRVINAKDIGPDVRLYLINTVQKFWASRMKGIEVLLNFAGKPDLVPKWKNEFNAQRQQ